MSQEHAPPAKPADDGKMTEWEKRLAGEPFDTAKLWQEMNDGEVDAITDGVREGRPAKPPETPAH